MNKSTSLGLCLFTAVSTAHAIDYNENLAAIATCIGSSSCDPAMSFSTSVGTADLWIKSIFPLILFEDTTSTNGTDFAIKVNEDLFTIHNEDANRRLFTIDNDAKTDSIFIGPNGVGLFTATPGASVELQVFSTSGSIANIRLDTPSTDFDIENDSTEFSILNVTSNQYPLRVKDGALQNTLILDDNSRVGIGTGTPQTKFHVSGNDGTTQALVTETSGSASPRNLLQLSNNGGVGFNLEDRSTGGASGAPTSIWRFAVQPTGFRISRDNTGGSEMEIRNDGSVQIGPGGTNQFFLTSTGNLSITGALNQGSDRNSKRDIESVDPQAVLAQLKSLPITRWTYKTDSAAARHIGPMAQDFYAAFGLGADDRHIAPLDAAGIALAAVQALQDQLAEKDARIAALTARVAELEQQQARLNTLETQVQLLLQRMPAPATTVAVQFQP